MYATPGALSNCYMNMNRLVSVVACCNDPCMATYEYGVTRTFLTGVLAGFTVTTCTNVLMPEGEYVCCVTGSRYVVSACVACAGCE